MGDGEVKGGGEVFGDVSDAEGGGGGHGVGAGGSCGKGGDLSDGLRLGTSASQNG